MSLVRTPIQITEHDLVVLGWFAAWTPEVHRADWKTRRAWPPGWREIADMSVYHGQRIAESIEKMSAPPLLEGETGPTRQAASKLTRRLLAYRLLEGSSVGVYRLTARGRAALLLHGRPCPDGFESHCQVVFDPVDLRPISGVNTELHMMDQLLHRLPDDIRTVRSGQSFPDDSRVWALMLEEYEGDISLNSSVRAPRMWISEVSSTEHHLNGSLRGHHSYMILSVSDHRGRLLMEVEMSHEQLAAVLVSQKDVVCTLNYTIGADGMARSFPAPPPLSIQRRMDERVRLEAEDLLAALRSASDEVERSSASKTSKAALARSLKLVADRVCGLGAFSAGQARDEISQVLEGTLGLMVPQGEIRKQLAGDVGDGDR